MGKEKKHNKQFDSDNIQHLREKIKSLEKELSVYKIKNTLFHRIQDFMRFGHFELDIKTEILTWFGGDGSKEITGEFETLLQQVIYPQDYQKTINKIRGLLSEQKTASVEFRILNSKSEIRYYRLESEIVYNDNKEPETVFGTYYDITESKLAIRAKKETEEQFALFMNFVPGAAFIKDKNHKLLYCNKFFASLIDKTPEEVIGVDISQLVPDEKEAEFIKENETVIRGRKVMELEHTYPGPDGPTHWLTFKFPIIRYDGSVLVGSLSLDVTDKKKAEQEIIERESRLQSIFRASPTGIGLFSKDRVFWSVNTVICDMTGYSREELIGNSTRMLYPSREEFEWVGREEQKQVKEKGTGTVETNWQRKDGELIQVLKSTTPLNMHDFDQGVTFTALDITERKKAEHELKDSQRMLTTLFHNLPGMAYRCKNDNFWTMEFISSGCKEITGYEPQDFINNSKLSYGEIIYPDDREMVEEIVYQGIKNNQHFDAEYRIITSDSEIKHVLERGVGIFSDDGDLLFLEGFISDITAKKQAELQLQNELKEKEVLLKEIHHRVKNNLQIIISLLNMQSNQHKDPYIKNALDECNSRIYSMALVHEKMYHTTNYSKIDLKEYISSITRDVFRSNQTGSNVSYDLDLDSIHLELSKAIPCGLILNELINNAFKHAFPENYLGKVVIKTKSKNEDHFYISVKDNGVGLPSSINFENSESMGFILVRVLTKQLEGKVAIKTSKKGTKFTLTLPV